MESVSKTRWRRRDDGVLHPAVFSFIFWLLRQTGESAQRRRNRRRRQRDEQWGRWHRVESRVIVSVDGVWRLAVHAGNFFRRGAQRPLRVAVVFISLRKVVILGGVGRPSVSSIPWDEERDWELGWLWRKSWRGGGGFGKGMGKGRLWGRRFFLC